MRTYTIRAMRIDGDSYQANIELNGNLEEIKQYLLENKFSHVSEAWTGQYRITIDEIDDFFLKQYDKKENKCLYLYYGFIDDLKRQLERLAGPGEPHPLWPVRDKCYVVKTDVFKLNFWIGHDPLIGILGIPIDEKFTFIRGLLQFLKKLPDEIGHWPTFYAIQEFYEKNGYPKDYSHPGYKKTDPIEYYGTF